MTHPKCSICPCPEGLACVEQHTGHGLFCWRLRERPELAPAIVEAARRQAGEIVERPAERPASSKPRIPLGTPHCPECVEQRQARADGGEPHESLGL